MKQLIRDGRGGRLQRDFKKSFTSFSDSTRKQMMFCFASRRRHTRFDCDWSSDVCSSDLISFEVGAYDRARPLVIDPVVTFLGGAASGGGGASIGRDAAGNIYVTQGSQGVIKLSPDGATALYTVQLGTSRSTYLAVDAAGNAYVLGRWAYPIPSGYGFEDPAYYPTTPNALGHLGRPHFRGDYTAVVAKLSPDGSTLLYSSYVGGDSAVEINGIAVDLTGNFF